MDCRSIGLLRGLLVLVLGALVVADLGLLVEGKGVGGCDPLSLCEVSEGNVGGVVEGCCSVLVAANDRGCFCAAAPQHWVLSALEVCNVALLTYGSLECASIKASSRSAMRKFGGQYARSAVHAESGFSALPDHVTEHEVGSEHAEGAGFEDGELSDGSGEILFGIGGCVMFSCAFLCPCFFKKRAESSKDSDSVNMITAGSNPTSRSFGMSPARYAPSPRAQLAPPAQPDIVAGRHFTMADIIRATDNFSPSRKIGQGGFGLVYQGRLPDDQIVAIKRAKKDAFEPRLSVEFQTEVDALSHVEHLNLVKLIGYLEENQERILVVEYVNNGNLREHLDASTGAILDIGKRLDIAIDVAHALTYLHTYSDRPIIHRDVKSSNILLTDTYRAKVADFGFSRAGPEDGGATHVSTQVKGTAGYLDPEYLNSYQLTQKSDVYSYGILLIEIFTGRRPIELKRPSDERVTVRWAWKKVSDGMVAEILDPKLERTQPALMMVEKVAELAFACSAPSRNDRPLMGDAVKELWTIRSQYQASMKEYGLAKSASNVSTASAVSLSSKKAGSDYQYDLPRRGSWQAGR